VVVEPARNLVRYMVVDSYPAFISGSIFQKHCSDAGRYRTPTAPLVRIDPGLLVRNDPPLSGAVFGDGGRRREEETSLLEVSALVSA